MVKEDTGFARLIRYYTVIWEIFVVKIFHRGGQTRKLNAQIFISMSISCI